jgi:hypothetical protein
MRRFIPVVLASLAPTDLQRTTFAAMLYDSNRITSMSLRRFLRPKLFLLALPLAVGACGDSNSTGPEISYHISGTVRIKDTATPMAGAVVSVYEDLFSDGSLAKQTTGSDGKYDVTFTARCPHGGTFLVVPTAVGYFPVNFYDFQCKDASGTLDMEVVSLTP